MMNQLRLRLQHILVLTLGMIASTYTFAYDETPDATGWFVLGTTGKESNLVKVSIKPSTYKTIGDDSFHLKEVWVRTMTSESGSVAKIGISSNGCKQNFGVMTRSSLTGQLLGKSEWSADVPNVGLRIAQWMCKQPLKDE